MSFSAILSAPQHRIRLYIFLQEFVHAIDDNMAISYMFMYENMNENTHFRDKKAWYRLNVNLGESWKTENTLQRLVLCFGFSFLSLIEID